MTPTQTQLARHRLVLGISNVGFWVLSAFGGLLWLVIRGAGACTPWTDGFLLLGTTVVQAGFDFVGGFLLMPPPRRSLGRFLSDWLRGALVHTLVLGSVGWLSYASFRWLGGFVPAVLLATAGLALTRRWMLRAVGGVSTTASVYNHEPILAADATDPAFTGGIDGWGARTASLLPAAWLRDLPPAEFAAEASRRRWQSAHGLPGRALLLILGWNAAGAAAGSFALGLAGHAPAGALLLHACWMTLWTFAGLLVLPSLSRKAVFAADRAALDAGDDPREWIGRFPGLVGEDGGANPFIQTIFYPVPSARERLLHLTQSPAAGFVPGNLARNNLYYSWAACTLLGRAVHCNVGRPALWVFPPSA